MSDYWEESAAFKKVQGLPKAFPREFYIALNNWFGSQPQVNPLHVQDLLAPGDSYY